MKDVGKFYVHLVYLTVITYILWPFGIFCVHFGIFFLLHQDKSGSPVRGGLENRIHLP
jgi:hypothetical protein